MALTEFTIRAAKPREKPYKLADSGGLYLLVQPGGSRLWRMKYRVDGKEKSLAFGSYPRVSLDRSDSMSPRGNERTVRRLARRRGRSLIRS